MNKGLLENNYQREMERLKKSLIDLE